MTICIASTLLGSYQGGRVGEGNLRKRLQHYQVDFKFTKGKASVRRRGNEGSDSCVRKGRKPQSPGGSVEEEEDVFTFRIANT